MLSSKKLTAILLGLLIVMIIRSTTASHNQARPNQSSNYPSQTLIEQQKKKQDELRSQFPVVDYDETEITDKVKLAKRKEKNKHFDNKNLVNKDPTTRITEAARIVEGADVPALTVAQSNLIVIGDVEDAQAHLSNDKSGVYTELTVRINEVIKNDASASLAQGGEVSVLREGGIVRYSNGHQRLYHMAEEGMPKTARKYVLFLRAIDQSQDYDLLTAYEISADGIVPVDLARRFKAYEGYDKETFLQTIRTLIN
jgi:hypothetical protein